MKIGTHIKIKPEYQDPGDADIAWITVDALEKGRVTIMALINTLTIKPTHVVLADWIEVVNDN